MDLEEMLMLETAAKIKGEIVCVAKSCRWNVQIFNANEQTQFLVAIVITLHCTALLSGSSSSTLQKA